MDNKENKKWSFAHFCAYISLAISITMLVLWCCNVGGFAVVSLDSFVGVIVALLAIVVTLAIGWQIFNSIEIRKRIEKLDALEEKFREHDKKMNQLYFWSQHLISANMGDFAFNNNQFLLAFLYYMKSLESSLSLKSPLNLDKILEYLSCITEQIKNGDVCDYLGSIQESDKAIRASKNYIIINRRYEKIYNAFISKTKEAKE